MRAAIVLTLLCAGLGVLAPYVPNFWVGFRFAWLAVCYLVGMGALSAGSRVVWVRFALGLIAGAVLSYLFHVFVEYDFDEDHMKPREWTYLILPYISAFGAIPSIFPAYQVLKNEEKPRVRTAHGRTARIRAGARIGFLQSGVIALIFAPVLYLASSVPAASRSPSSEIPPELLQGPHFQGHFSFFCSLVLTLVITGTLCGAMAGLFFDIQSKDKAP